MSYCVSHGKDKVMFLTDEDLKGPSKIKLPEDNEPKGFLLPNGEINWGCPCLGNMVVGPCNIQFRESLTCFHKSTADPKGSDCLKEFREMNDCMARYPQLYKRDEEADAALQNLEEQQEVLAEIENEENLINSSTEQSDTNVAQK